MRKRVTEVLSQIARFKEDYRKEGFEILGIFGSYARGTASNESDIDIAYRIDYDKFSQRFHGGFSKLIRIDEIKEELQRRLGMRVDLVSVDTSNTPLKKEIEKELLRV